VSTRSRDVRVNITSEHDERGFKSAEQSAKVLERELNKLEQQQRRQVQMQTQAAREMAHAEAQKAAAIVEANRRQADAMQSAGRVLLGVSTAVAVGLGLTAKAAMDWESAWAGVTKTVDGSPEQMAALEQQLRNLARTLPATHEEIAGVAEAAGQLGVRRQDVAAFTKTMIDLGETTNLSADEAATSLAQLSNIMGVSARSASQLGSTLVALGNDGASTERDIVSMSLRIAGAGRTVGLTAPQVMGLASALSSVGIEAEAGGTAISRVMLQINKDVDAGSDTLEGYAHVAGMTADEFARKWKAEPAEALDAFIRGLGRMQAQGLNTTAMLDDLGFKEVRVSDALRRASLAGDLLTESLRTGSAAFDENIALVEEANKRYATTESRLQMARNEINDAAIDIGGNLLPALAGAADGVASLAAGFGSLSPEVQGAVTKFGAAAAGVAGITGTAAIGIPKLAELARTITDLRGGSSLLGRALGGTAAVLAGPWGLAIAAATFGIGVWLMKQGEARRRIDELTASIDENTGAWSDLSREIVFSDLLESGVIDAAKAAGLSLETVLDAALGSTAAYKELEKQVNATYDALAASPATYDPKFAQDAYEVLEGLRSKSEEAEKAQAAYQLRVEAGLGPTDEATAATQEFSGALEQGKSAADEAADALDLLSKALDNLNDPTLDARDAERRFQEAIDDVTDSIKDNGVELDLNTQKGRANEAALDSLARAGARRAQALLEQTGSEEQFRASLEQSRQALYEAALQFGLSEEAAWAYVDQVLKVPPVVQTDVIADTGPAQRAIDQVIRYNTGRQIPLTIHTNGNLTPYVQGYDSGGWTGPGGKYQLAGVVHADEHVIRKESRASIEQVAPGYLEALNRQGAAALRNIGDVASRVGGVYVRGSTGAALLASSRGASATSTPPAPIAVRIDQVNTRDSADAIADGLMTKARDALAVHGLVNLAGGLA